MDAMICRLVPFLRCFRPIAFSIRACRHFYANTHGEGRKPIRSVVAQVKPLLSALLREIMDYRLPGAGFGLIAVKGLNLAADHVVQTHVAVLK